MKSKILLLATLCSITLLSAGCYQQDHQLLRPKVEESSVQNEIQKENYNTSITVGNKKLLVEVVNTDASRELGLSNRKSLSDENGMLFDFTNTDIVRPSFWMKDMDFDLDLIWIENGKIIGISSGATKPTAEQKQDTSKLATYDPPSDITQVLEVNGGWCKKNNIKVGDTININ